MELEPGKLQFIFQNRSQGFFINHKGLAGFFLCIFTSLTCLKKPVFSKRDLLRRKVPASLSLFLKREKVSALLYGGKEPEFRPFSYTEEPPNAGSDFRRDRMDSSGFNFRRDRNEGYGSSISEPVFFCREIELSSSPAKIIMWGSAGRRFLQRRSVRNGKDPLHW